MAEIEPGFVNVGICRPAVGAGVFRAILAIEILLLSALLILWWLVSPQSLSGADWRGLVLIAAPLGIAAMSQVLPIIGGGQGLSAGATLVLGAAIATSLPAATVGEALFVVGCAVAGGLAIGMFNGVVIGLARLRSTPVTLAVGGATLAVALQVIGAGGQTNPSVLGDLLIAPQYLHIPVVPVLALALTCLLGEVFLASRLGRSLRKQEGESPLALCAAYVMAGIGGGLGGVLLGVAYGSTDVGMAAPVLLQILAAIALGGGIAGLRGGSVLGALLGALIVCSTGNLLFPLGIPDHFSTIFDAFWLLLGTCMALWFYGERKPSQMVLSGNPRRLVPTAAMILLAPTAIIILCRLWPESSGEATIVAGLALLAAGQMSVLRRKTLDLSMPSLIAAAAITTVTITQGRDALLPPVCAALLVFAVIVGLVNSWLATRIGRSVLVFPLILAGCAQAWIGYLLVDFPTGFAPSILSDLTYRSWMGVPVSAWMLLGLAVAVVLAVDLTENRPLGRALPFVFSGVASTAFGIMLAGFGGGAHFSQMDTFFLPAIAIAFLADGFHRPETRGIGLVLPLAIVVVGTDTYLVTHGAAYATRIVVTAGLVLLGELLHRVRRHRAATGPA